MGVVKLLLAYRGDPNIKDNQGYTAYLLNHSITSDLTRAVQANDTFKAQELLVRGADPNCKDQNGKTPLAWAVHFQRQEMVCLPLAHGGDPNCEAVGSSLGPEFGEIIH